MRNLFTNPSPFVNAGKARSGITLRRQTLQIVNGSAWITVEGEPDDYWLSSGDALDVRPGRLVVVEANRGDVVLNIASSTTSPGIWSTAVRPLQRGWRALLFAFRRPVRDCVSTINAASKQACDAALSASGGHRLGRL
jgi:hypothetical protein